MRNGRESIHLFGISHVFGAFASVPQASQAQLIVGGPIRQGTSLYRSPLGTLITHCRVDVAARKDL